LTDSGVQFADFNAASTNIGLQLFQVGVNLVDILLETVDITAQKDCLIAGLADARLQLKNTRLELINIRPQRNHVQINPIRYRAIGFEFSANMLVFAVPSINIAILGENCRSQLKYSGI
jgi:hypothetical protein